MPDTAAKVLNKTDLFGFHIGISELLSSLKCSDFAVKEGGGGGTHRRFFFVRVF